MFPLFFPPDEIIIKFSLFLNESIFSNLFVIHVLASNLAFFSGPEQGPPPDLIVPSLNPVQFSPPINPPFFEFGLW